MTAAMDPVDPAAGESFAWCFSHGRLHRFRAEPWCTATWIRLLAATEDDARAEKEFRFGPATFLDELPLETQAEITAANETEVNR